MDSRRIIHTILLFMLLFILFLYSAVAAPLHPECSTTVTERQPRTCYLSDCPSIRSDYVAAPASRTCLYGGKFYDMQCFPTETCIGRSGTLVDACVSTNSIGYVGGCAAIFNEGVILSTQTCYDSVQRQEASNEGGACESGGTCQNGICVLPPTLDPISVSPSSINVASGATLTFGAYSNANQFIIRVFKNGGGYDSGPDNLFSTPPTFNIPSSSFATTGTYTVQAQACNSAGTCSVPIREATVTVNAPTPQQPSLDDITVTPATVNPGQSLRITFVNPQRADKCYFHFKKTTEALFNNPLEVSCSGFDTSLIAQLPSGVTSQAYDVEGAAWNAAGLSAYRRKIVTVQQALPNVPSLDDITVTPATVNPGQSLRITFVNPQRADKCYFHFKKTTEALFNNPLEVSCSGFDTSLIAQLPSGVTSQAYDVEGAAWNAAGLSAYRRKIVTVQQAPQDTSPPQITDAYISQEGSRISQGANVLTGKPITANVSATDSSGIFSIVIYLNNAPVVTCSRSPCEYTTAPLPESLAGTAYSLYTNVTDAASARNSVRSNTLIVNVLRPGQIVTNIVGLILSKPAYVSGETIGVEIISRNPLRNVTLKQKRNSGRIQETNLGNIGQCLAANPCRYSVGPLVTTQLDNWEVWITATDVSNNVVDSNHANFVLTPRATTPQQCTDSDGGNNIFTRGTAAGPEWATSNPVSIVDYCISEGEKRGHLSEFYCAENNQVISQTFGPADGCSRCVDGACVREITLTREYYSQLMAQNRNAKETTKKLLTENYRLYEILAVVYSINSPQLKDAIEGYKEYIISLRGAFTIDDVEDVMYALYRAGVNPIYTATLARLYGIPDAQIAELMNGAGYLPELSVQQLSNLLATVPYTLVVTTDPVSPSLNEQFKIRAQVLTGYTEEAIQIDSISILFDGETIKTCNVLVLGMTCESDALTLSIGEHNYTAIVQYSGRSFEGAVSYIGLGATPSAGSITPVQERRRINDRDLAERTRIANEIVRTEHDNAIELLEQYLINIPAERRNVEQALRNILMILNGNKELIIDSLIGRLTMPTKELVPIDSIKPYYCQSICYIDSAKELVESGNTERECSDRTNFNLNNCNFLRRTPSSRNENAIMFPGAIELRYLPTQEPEGENAP
ncbi:MAG: hypothetical protein AABX33_02695 [Nanoarchaeota archaeon]